MMRAIGYNRKSDKRQISPYLPDFYADSIFDIDFALLEQLGVRHIMLDLDQTLRQAYSRALEDEVIELFARLRRNHSFETVNIVSNNSRNLSRYSKPIGARVFQPFWKKRRFVRKPSKVFYDRVLRELNIKPSAAVMIGDKIRNDVFGANRAGVYSVLVKPFGRDYWFDQILFARLREKRSLALALQTKSQHQRSTPDYIRQALTTINIKADDIFAQNKRMPRPDTYIAVAGKKKYFIKLIGNRKTVSDWLRQAKDRIIKLGRYDATAYLNPKHATELQSFISKEAANAGVRTPDIIGVIDLGDFRYGVVQEFLEATPLSQLKSADISDELLKDSWQQIAQLHKSAIAHRDLRADNILIDHTGKPNLVHFDYAILAASKNSTRQDNAQFIASLALTIGIQRAAESARQSLRKTELEQTIPFMRLNYLSPQTRHRLRRKPNLLRALQQALEQ